MFRQLGPVLLRKELALRPSSVTSTTKAAYNRISTSSPSSPKKPTSKPTPRTPSAAPFSNYVAGLLKAQAEGSDEIDEDDEDMEQPKKTVDEILRYQDPTGDMQSGLHAAVQAESREVAWLLLLLASDLDISQFPALVFQEAGALGVMRDEKGLAGKVDIRTLRDMYGRTAEQLAVEVGGVWNGWPGTGRLAV
ncbi:hypothetical protein B0A49_08862 [Cryomyces minteri]|uniref:Uncharacterized protein n=1 Tax=Cryomyces minteri TaxID=331657 RepID=A0A4U0WUP9_9PEZI|nr:hypothetical protein B0A49_08862 [Cryomyces minteri]